MKLTVLMIGAVLGSATLGIAQAGQETLQLTGANETPPVTTKANGVATLNVQADGTVSGGVKTAGIEGTAAHIHVGAAGASGPPIVTLERAGADQWMVPQGAKLSTSQYAEFKKGDLYLNVHSKAHPGGEIRAQLAAP